MHAQYAGRLVAWDEGLLALRACVRACVPRVSFRFFLFLFRDLIWLAGRSRQRGMVASRIPRRVWCGVVWCGAVWCGVLWYGMV